MLKRSCSWDYSRKMSLGVQVLELQVFLGLPVPEPFRSEPEDWNSRPSIYHQSFAMIFIIDYPQICGKHLRALLGDNGPRSQNVAGI